MMNPTMEEEDYNQGQHINKKNKHVCKFCSRSFPCGRSLGGHMRSHVINGDIDHHHDNNKLLASSSTAKIKKMLSSSSSTENNTGIGSEGYGLRENPKKTWRLTNSTSEDNSLLFCKDCGKGFQSWRALFGHMKCHSSEKVESMECDQDSSWTNNSASHSDNEEANAPSRRRRSKRTRTRYIAPLSAPAATTTDSSVSEADEHEQEEVAMSLMMLSRDLSPWCGVNSVSEFSKNKNKKLVNIGSEFSKLGSYLSSPNLSSKGKKSSEFLATESAKGVKVMNNTTVSVNGFSKIIGKDKKKYELDSESAFEEGTTNNKYNSIKAKFWDCGSNKKPNSSEGEFSIKSSSSHNHKRGKFECTTCNKIFHSYQALGGHRASHKKIKGCSFASRNNNDQSSENSIEFEAEAEAEHEEAPPPAPSSPTPTDNNNEYASQQVHEFGNNSNGFDRESKKGNKNKGHECPICFKVFSSGQALGGHKRSHMASASDTGNFHQTVVLQESSVPEIRDLLDLNLPVAEAAATEEDDEEEINAHASDSYTTWWENHKQEALVGLMSN
ncbi:hypothetical protein HN51_020763 [Arachis hypogaea]|uniref:C2H2-type domain-containing protein n=1 Tax=Arachis hypogaea TaxID=3818 RepID=A0A445C286_ARAHY|nr:zinc finger protein ZAT4 [Arachis hypogaea]QHO32787.1 Zinc finger protein [Arachis hypogaea]RYR45021.1 hypothetical protein Ahy_A08g041274 [Arachis hypogaea]